LNAAQKFLDGKKSVEQHRFFPRSENFFRQTSQNINSILMPGGWF